MKKCLIFIKNKNIMKMKIMKTWRQRLATSKRGSSYCLCVLDYCTVVNYGGKVILVSALFLNSDLYTLVPPYVYN